MLAHARATARDAAGKTGLVHELDRHVLQQMAKLGLAHAILEFAAGVAQAQVLGNRRHQVVHARRGLDILRGHERHAGVHQHVRANLVLADGDLKDVEQACHNSPLLVLALLVAVVRIRRARTRRRRLLCRGLGILLIGFGRSNHANERDALATHRLYLELVPCDLKHLSDVGH